MSGFKRKILDFFLILIIGGLGGILADQFFLPYLANVSPFSKIKFIQRAKDSTTIINPTERVIITENTAIEEAIEQIRPRLVAISVYQQSNFIKQGTGFVVTSDGLIVTANDLISDGNHQYLVGWDNRSVAAQVIKRDSKNNLALLKIAETNLSVVAFAELSNLRLGERVVLVGVEATEGGLSYFVNLGIIRSIASGVLKVNLTEENALANGGPLINTKGEVIGLNLVNQTGLAKIIPASKIKALMKVVP